MKLSNDISAERVSVVIPAYNEGRNITTPLHGLIEQEGVGAFDIVVVDNGSTDDTAGTVHGFAKEHDLKIHVVEEPNKGTGHASRAGFDFAINTLGATIIARTDADTLPVPTWLASSATHIAKGASMATGPSLPLRDRFHRPQDELMWPLMSNGGRLLFAARFRSLFPLKMPYGHNTIVSSDAYLRAEGYTPTSIEQCDEDVALAQKVYENVGWRGFAYDTKTAVHTSMRRRRHYSMLKMLQIYILDPANEGLRRQNGSFDIR